MFISPGSRAGKRGFASSAKAWANKTTALTALGVSNFIQTLLDDADAASARATLGVTWASDAEFIARSATNRILTPGNLAARPHFRANKNGTNQTGIADSTLTKITFTTESVDVGSYYDTTNSRWRPPAGPVSLSASAFISGTLVDGGSAYTAIYKNGAMLLAGAPEHTSNTTSICSAVNGHDTANGTDYYEVYVLADTSAGTATVSGNATVSWFSGVWLG